MCGNDFALQVLSSVSSLSSSNSRKCVGFFNIYRVSTHPFERILSSLGWEMLFGSEQLRDSGKEDWLV